MSRKRRRKPRAGHPKVLRAPHASPSPPGRTRRALIVAGSFIGAVAGIAAILSYVGDARERERQREIATRTHLLEAFDAMAGPSNDLTYTQAAGVDQESLKRAQKEIELALMNDPASVGAKLAQGMVQRRSGQLIDAIKAYQEVIRECPSCLSGYNNLSAALMDLGQAQEAAAILRATTNANPRYAIGLYNLGYALAALGDLPNAVSAYREALQLRPKHLPTINNFGEALMKLKRYREARQQFEAAVRIGTNRPRVYANLIVAQLRLGAYDDAEMASRTLIKLAPDQAVTYDFRWRALFMDNQLDEADLACRHALQLDPRYASALLGLGIISERRGNTKAAANFYARAFSTDPSLKEVMDRFPRRSDWVVEIE